MVGVSDVFKPILFSAESLSRVSVVSLQQSWVICT